MKAFGNPHPPKWFSDSNEPNSKVGKSKGLTLVLDAHTNLIAPGTVNDDIQGFYSLVNGPAKYPLLNEGSKLLQTGHETFVAISAIRYV